MLEECKAAGHGHADTLRIRKAQPLGEQLAHHNSDVRHNKRDDNGCQRQRDTGMNTQFLHPRGKRVRQRRRSSSRSEEAK